MNIIQNFKIMEPFNLPWRYVSPANYKGLEYHLSPNLSIKLEGLYRSTVKVDEKGNPISDVQELEFIVGAELLVYEGFEVDRLNAEQVYMNEIHSTKSQERIKKSFADKRNILSCFFTERQMEMLHKSFETSFFVCSKVTVVFDGKEMEDIAELPQTEYKMALDAFDELNVHGAFEYKGKNKEEMQNAYAHYYEKKVAKEEDKQKAKLWDKVKNKETRRGMVKAFGSLAIGVAGWMIKRRLSSGSVLSAVVGVVAGVISIGAELYGRQQANNVMRSL